MALLLILLIIVFLVLLIVGLKIHPFLAFLLASIFGGIVLGIPIGKIPKAIEVGMGGLLGGLTIVICLGAMFGKLVAESGAAQQITQSLMRVFGESRLQWALMFTGFVVGIPLFYNVGFVLLIPLVFSLVYQYKLPAVFLGISMLAALSVTHGFLPPHPSPTALVEEFGAEMGTTLMYGLIVALPAMILAGPVYASRLKHIHSRPLDLFKPSEKSDDELPSSFNSFFSALLPVFLLIGSSVLPYFAGNEGTVGEILEFLANPNIVLIVALAIATYSLGISRKMPVKKIMGMYGESIKDIAVILLIVAGAGGLKQIFIESGVSDELGAMLSQWDVNLLFLGWVTATLIRVSVGSATVAGLTTAGIIAPLVAGNPAVDPNLMVLAIGAGSLMFSHVNDSGFWMYKEYFNLSIKDTFLSWTVMETIVGVVGLIGVLLLDFFLV
ncbi:MAG: GntP family permease [Bacteroidia bacterium]|nr:GntP family permease [Bacteroidia bacterium]